MRSNATVPAAGATPAAPCFNNEDLTMGLSTNDEKVAIATVPDPAIAPPRVARVCREEIVRRGETRHMCEFDPCVHASESEKPSGGPEPTPTHSQVDRTRDSPATSALSMGLKHTICWM